MHELFCRKTKTGELPHIETSDSSLKVNYSSLSEKVVHRLY